MHDKIIQIIPAEVGKYAFYGISNDNQCEDTRESKTIICWALIEFQEYVGTRKITSNKIEGMVIDNNEDCVCAKSIPDFSGYSV